MKTPNAPRARFATGGKLLVFWTVVGIPLGWGAWQVLLKSVALFAA